MAKSPLILHLRRSKKGSITYKCVNVLLLQGPVIAMHITDMQRVSLTFSDWASKDFRLLVTFFSSSSRSLALLWREAGMCLVLMEERRVRACVSLCSCLCVHWFLPFWDLGPLLSSLQFSLQDHQLTGHLGRKILKLLGGNFLDLNHSRIRKTRVGQIKG